MFVAMRTFVASFLLLALLPIAAAEGAKRPITEKDLLRFTWVADPQFSPDGARVIFVRVTVNQVKDAFETSVWMVSAHGGEPRRLTNGPRDSSPRWSPDGTQIVFSRLPEQEGTRQTGQLYVLSLAGGEPQPLTKLPRGAGSPVWSPDGKRIAFLSTTTASDLKKAESAKTGIEGSDPQAGRESDVRIITRAEFRRDTGGYFDLSQLPNIWTLSVPAATEEPGTPKQLTSGIYGASEPVWSPDGTRLYFTSTGVAEPYYHPRQNELYFISAEGGDTKKLCTIQGTIGQLSVSRDGRHIAFRGRLGQPTHSYMPPDLFVVETRPGALPRNLTAAFDYDIGGGLAADQHPPRGGRESRPIWNRDGSGLIELVAREGRARLMAFDASSGRVTSVTSGDQEVVSFTASADGSKLAVLISTPTGIGDLFLVEAENGRQQQLTHVNARLFSEIRLSSPEEIRYASFDGKIIHAWIQKPPDFDPKNKYPLILNIHGGPHIPYGFTFMHEFQLMAAKGYVVLYPNPRGSSSYGAEFGNIIQYHYPGDDYKDLMAGVDELIRRGYVDEKRLGVTGGSGGGLLTNWVVTQTDRFAAAVAQRSIADWAAWWYTADFTLFQPYWFKTAPFKDPAEFAARSPITFVERVKTPLMFIEGEADYRTPPGAGGEAMFRALKYLKKPVVMVQFPGESHELSRSGKPWHRIERLQHILNWFDKHLQGKPTPQYDVPADLGTGASDRPAR